MHILIDIQGAQNGSRHRGIGRYTRALVNQLSRLSLGRHRISLLANGAFDNVDDLKKMFAGYVHEADVHVWYPFGDPSFRWVGNNLRRKASEYLREAVIHEIQPDILLVSSAVEGCDDATVITINKHFDDVFTSAIFYDAIPAIYEKEYLADARSHEWYYEKIEQLKRANAIFSISESSKTEAIEYFNISESVVTNISTAVSDDFCASARTAKQCANVLNRLSIGSNYLLYSGASDARKNLPRLIEAFSVLSPDLQATYQLVLAGGMPQVHIDQLRTVSRSVGLNDEQVIFTGWVSDDELAAIYASATLFVFPSFHEGFGLPILEAMNYGIPVIAANVSSIPEVVKLEEALFDPMDTHAIADKIESALLDRGLRDRLIANSEDRRQAFSWQRTAQAALDVIEGIRPRSRRARDAQAHARHVQHILDLLGPDAALMPPKDIIGPIERSLPQDAQPIQIFVDVSELHARDSKTGIQRVVRNILAHLQEAAGKKYAVVPVATDLTTEYRVSNKVGLQLISNFAPIANPVPNFRRGDVFLGLDLQDVLVPHRADFFEKLHESGILCYFVVYDMLPLKLREYFPDAVSRNFNGWLNTVARSDGLVAISRSVMMDIQAWAEKTKLPLRRPLRLGHFRLGADIESEVEEAPNRAIVEWLEKRRKSRVFVTIGTIEPRKRHDQIVDAMNNLWKGRDDVSLVIIGKVGWQCDDLVESIRSHNEFGRRLLWLEGATDADLLAVLRSADALVAASEGEGFGLPLVEAQRLGVPIIARDLPVFREVAGDDAVYFTGFSGSELSDCLDQWLNNNKKMASRIEKEIDFTWSDAANSIAKVICENRWSSTIF
ncbi:MAG: glycosyltransferase family 1 protein [Novosphingobium sp.]|nr:glycosyltransferase family 1 protein [Novosphingobium sp.]